MSDYIYNRVNWRNDSTPLNETNMNIMDEGIDQAFKKINEVKNTDISNLVRGIGLKLDTNKEYVVDTEASEQITQWTSAILNSDLKSFFPFSISELNEPLLYFLVKEIFLRTTFDSEFVKLLNIIRFVLGDKDVENLPEGVISPIKGTTGWAPDAETYTEVIDELMTLLVGKIIKENEGTDQEKEVFIEGRVHEIATDIAENKVSTAINNFKKAYTGNINNVTNITTFGQVIAYIKQHRTEFTHIVDEFNNFVTEIKGGTIQNSDGQTEEINGLIKDLIQSEHSKIGQGTLDPTDPSNHNDLKDKTIYFRYEA